MRTCSPNILDNFGIRIDLRTPETLAWHTHWRFHHKWYRRLWRKLSRKSRDRYEAENLRLREVTQVAFINAVFTAYDTEA